jgi:hypothetical protein
MCTREFGGNGKAKPRAIAAGAAGKGFKEMILCLSGQTWAIVRNVDMNMAMCAAGGKPDLRVFRCCHAFRQRLRCVTRQIEQQPEELIGVGIGKQF